MDLVKRTLGLLEQRISNNESNLKGMMDFIRNEDLNYQPTVAKAVVEEADSPQKAAHIYNPATYKMMEQVPEDAHRPVHNALAG